MEEVRPEEALSEFQGLLEQEQQALKDLFDELTDKLGNARQVLRICAGAVEKRRAELDDFSTRVSEDLTNLRQHIDEADGAATREVHRHTEVLENKLRDLQAELDEAREQSATVALDLERARAEATAQTETTNRLEQDLAALRDELNAREQDTSQAEKLDVLIKTESELRSELEKVRAEGEQAAERAGELDETIASLRRELETARTEAVTFKQGRASVESDLQDLREERLSLSRDLETTQAELAKAHTEAAAWRAKAETSVPAEELQHLRNQLEDERERRAAIEEQLQAEQAKGTKSALAVQLAEALKEAEEAQAELRQLRKQLDHSGKHPSPFDDAAPTARQKSSQEASDEDLQRRILTAATEGGGKRAIGEILTAAGIVTKAQIEEAMEEQRRQPTKHLGAILVEREIASPAAVAQALACQCKAEFIRFNEKTVDPAAASLISSRLAQQHTCIPVSTDGNTLRLALVNPMDLLAIEDVERSTGREVEVVVGTASDIQAAIEKHYWEPE